MFALLPYPQSSPRGPPSIATMIPSLCRCEVSDEWWPRSERLDGLVLFVAADQCAVDQPQVVSSAIRLLRQLLTSLVSRSLRYASGLTPCSLQLSINEAGIAQFSAPSSLP